MGVCGSEDRAEMMPSLYEWTTSVRFVYHLTSKIGFYRVQSGYIFNEIYIFVTGVVNDVTCSYTCGHNTIDYMTVSTGKQRRDMIICIHRMMLSETPFS